MECLTSEVMFYGGIALTGCTMVLGIIFMFISHINKMRLDIQLDAEYGKEVRGK